MGELGHRDHLKDPAVAGKKQEANVEDREGHDYFTLRGNESDSLLLGARTAVAESMELLFWERKLEGLYGKNETDQSLHSHLDR